MIQERKVQIGEDGYPESKWVNLTDDEAEETCYVSPFVRCRCYTCNPDDCKWFREVPDGNTLG